MADKKETPSKEATVTKESKPKAATITKTSKAPNEVAPAKKSPKTNEELTKKHKKELVDTIEKK